MPPNNIVKLLGGIPTSELKDCRLFDDRASQSAYFSSKSFKMFTNVTYQRMEKAVTVKANAESLHGKVGYIMFQNTQYSNRWYYGYIRKIEYVNAEATKITFDIDPFQTWGVGLPDGDVTFGECLIERETVSNDSIGVHRLEENLNVGELKVIDRTNDPWTSDYTWVIGTTVGNTLQDVRGEVYTGVYGGLAYYGFDNYNNLNLFIDVLAQDGKADAIKTIFAFPSNFIFDIDGATARIESPLMLSLVTEQDKYYGSLDGYTPRNNKLYTFPYNFMDVLNNQGESRQLKYENFSTPTMFLTMRADLSPNPTLMLHPQDYNGEENNYSEAIVMTKFPQCTWTSDLYNNWIAQNQISNAVGVTSAVLGLGASIIAGNPIGIAGSVIQGAGTIGQFYEKSILPNELSGKVSAGFNIGADLQHFTFYKKCVRAEQAKIIDNYFSRFGYKVAVLKEPDFRTRSKWTYVKMTDVIIKGDIPTEEKDLIVKHLMEGVTFWHDDNVGDYDRSNPS